MVFPPSPKNEKAALEYVSSLRKRSGASDFQTISTPILTFSTVGAMMLAMTVSSVGDFQWYNIALSAFLFMFAGFCFVSAYRFYVLLQVFDDGRSFNDHLKDGGSGNS